jgi:hypothetical protein
MDLEDYKIVTEPSLKYVMQNKKMSFFLKKVNPEAEDVERLWVRWDCVNHTNEDKKKQNSVKGPNGSEWLNATWSLRGVHTVVCTVKKTLGDRNPKTYHYVQHVISQDECLSYDSGTFEETENPFNVLHNLKKQIELIRALEANSQLNEDENSKYQERIKNIETYAKKLEYLLEKIPNSHKENFKIITARHYSNEYPDTNSILLQVCYFYTNNKVYLLDWTSPTQQGWCGVFEGKGETEQAAVLDALETWESNNRYPNGILKCRYLCASHPTLEIPKFDGEGLLSWEINDHHYSEEYQFTTDGSTWLDSISNALSWVAIGASIIAGAILFFVPGGQVATAALWAMAASAVAGTAASVINIAQRYNTGFNNWKDDGIDSLTIAASLCGLSSLKILTKWKPHAFLPMSVGNISNPNVVKAMIIGQVAADSALGIMISTDVASAIYSTIEDKTIPPDEKLSRILRLIAAGVTVGALTYINIKSARASFSFIEEDASLVRKMTREEVDAMLKNPEIIILEHGEGLSTQSTRKTTEITTIEHGGESTTQSTRRIPEITTTEHGGESSTQLAIIPETRTAVRQLQELKLLPFLDNTITHPPKLLPNILIINQDYLYNLTMPPMIELFLKKELFKYINLDNPIEAIDYALSDGLLALPDKSASNKKIQVLVRVDDQTSSTTEVDTVIEESYALDNIEKFKQMARSSGVEDSDWKKLKAISRATCTVEGITFETTQEFANLPFNLKQATEAKVVFADTNKFTGNSAPIQVINIDRYISKLAGLYPNKKMDKLTEDLIKNYLVTHKNHLSNFDGMPGAHAEILAVDYVFKQLRARGLDPKTYLSAIEVYTLKTNRPAKEDDFLREFEACANCSGILDPQIKVHTGRQGERNE